ncbi:MAG TPA: TonB-dependent hemoglobin/transferrin/lactoferrin family receptor [Amaricoccus sp.]|uniref:TonB-dependent hemoglobin/transferrin/lactoferrin family receptor n=1 Tax=Amaricoccus sp. TaxID=1872485 RepID=UPI002BB2FF27|nr:TonB-dependent hemoglobin/transferrin/lactoferrin family receptor [Amaricoccus sp.]HMQ93910.1 TonB-dependent hemoglobin/transferrin/lactoferrin family receptor [Amaricoccus sp.]HMR51844.1 TonB-dependent hemoglobin/transferrin/lactoferrin family receptor [Amaricoccus sp.]HMR60270.1 TonB-dependent hemoglobin/transferrin/lactoferrin family receptor [Amaricoccus sp.]HMU01389.1 TonB-dependent hemoglobin/transferrin/lactoferrin family receptor [Amaricoccus sp.]
MRYAMAAAAATLLASSAAAQESFVLDPILVVSAARDARPLLDTPVAASVIEGEALAVKQATDFQELIGDAPGLTIEGGPRSMAQEPNIRGFQNDQIVLRLDGGRFNFDQAHRGRFFIDPDLVERVEIIRGGGSTLYGSGALGGVIALETRDVDDILAPGDDFGGRLLGGYSSNGEIGQASASLAGRSGDVDALGYIGWQPMGDNLVDGAGDAIEASALDIVNGLVKLGYEPNAASRFELSGSLYRDQGTVPVNGNDLSNPTTDVDRDADVSTARLAWTYAPEGSDLVDLSVLGYYNGLEITEDRLSDGRADVTDYDTTGFEIVNRSSFAAGVPMTVVYGLEAFRDTQSGIRNGEAKPQFPDAEADTIGVFAEATIQVTERLEIVPGLRYDDYGRDPDADGLADVNEGFWSPRLGVSYRPTENWQVYGNLARAFRAPGLTELYNDGVHFAVGGFPLGPGATFTGINEFVPNPELEPEKSTQYEIGARYAGGGVFREGDQLTASANGYYADVEDFIDQTVTFIDFSTATPVPGGVLLGGTTTTENVDATLWGFEGAVTYDAGLWFGGLALTVPRGEAEDGSALGSIPQDRLSATLGYRPSDPWELGVEATFAARQDDVPEGAEPGEAWTTVDVFGSWAPQAPRFQGAVLRAGIDNLFDEEYMIYPNGLNQPGRTFKLTATVLF